jgi:hypothetical protein
MNTPNGGEVSAKARVKAAEPKQEQKELGRMVLLEWSNYVKCKRILDEYHKQNDEKHRLTREDAIDAEERYLAHVWMTDG